MQSLQSFEDAIMPKSYLNLAPIYDKIGMSAFSEKIAPQILDYAFRHDWLGRQIIDLGCGTGTGAAWFANESFSVIGIDQSPEMLKIATSKANSSMGLSINWEEADIRKLDDSSGQADMVIALDVLNEMENLREIESVFASVSRVLREGKLFFFDMYTIKGLSQRGEIEAQVIYNDASMMALAQNQYDFERQTSFHNYTSFIHTGDNSWTRHTGMRALHAYPVKAIAALLLQHAKFSAINLLSETMYPLGTSGYQNLNRVIFSATK